MVKEKLNNSAEQPLMESTIQETGREQLEQKSASEAAETILKEKIEKLKLDTMAKVVSLVGDTDRDLLIKLDKIVQDAVKESVAIGQVSGLPAGTMENLTGSLKDTFERAINPSDAHRASKYRQLYYNQRLAFSHLLSALQFADSQVGVYEVGQDPFASPMSKMVGGGLGTVLGTI